MSIRLTALRGVASRTVNLRGEAVTVRPTASAVLDAVYALYPPPLAPLIHNPDAGSLAPKIPDERDPAYVAAKLAWSRKTDCIEAAIVMDVAVDGLGTRGEAGPERLRAWCELAAAEAGSVLTREEVRAVLLAAKEAAEDGIREARGN